MQAEGQKKRTAPCTVQGTVFFDGKDTGASDGFLPGLERDVLRTVSVHYCTGSCHTYHWLPSVDRWMVPVEM